ncbi:hypothetical protein GCM10009809_38200 [Isoptericola hypogeus]|uniref:Uncharacterized protein n=1 Tax=Isoptericola hypogeus TaxID=300179 RepID=A0ABN2JU72_9MICO
MSFFSSWEPVHNPISVLGWLEDQEDPLTGYWAPSVFEDSTWILHAMYQDESLLGLGTHDDVEKESIRRGLRGADVVGGIDLSAATVDSGTPLGWAERPDGPWKRLRWREHFGPAMDATLDRRPWPPNDAALRSGQSWSASISAPPEGSLDEASLDALVDVLAGVGGAAAPILAFYGQVPANNYESPTLLVGGLDSIGELVDQFGSTPSNLWPADRSWFVMTDWDITSTCLWGPTALVHGVRQHDDLETVDWAPPQHVSGAHE